jgi:hypothetical protein
VEYLHRFAFAMSFDKRCEELLPPELDGATGPDLSFFELDQAVPRTTFPGLSDSLNRQAWPIPARAAQGVDLGMDLRLGPCARRKNGTGK